MAAIEPTLFTWEEVEARSDLDRFFLVRDHLPDEQIIHYLEVMRGQGHETCAATPGASRQIRVLRYVHGTA